MLQLCSILRGLVFVRADGPIDLSRTNGWTDPPVPTNHFSARWTGVLRALTNAEHVLSVSANAGAGFRLKLFGSTVIDNWDHPNPGAVELSTTNWLSTSDNEMVLEYKELAGGVPRITLSWMELGTTNKAAVPRSQLKGPDLGTAGPTGVSVDAMGNIWAANYANHTAMRINPNAGELVVTNGGTNFLGEVDLVVPLGDGQGGSFNPHQHPYDVAAQPYNYSDMTGFNNRIVNPTLQPLKGYWTVAEDSGNAGQLWNKVSWNAALTNGCSVEVYVRAADERNGLGSKTFIPVTNNVFFPSIRGRYVEVRLGLTRDEASKQPVLYDLTLYGTSSGFAGDFFLDDAIAYETDDATFAVNLVGAEPMTYQWYRLYPWETNWVEVAGATNATFTLTNVDYWLTWETNTTLATCLVSNGNGETVWLGPAYLGIVPLTTLLPAFGTIGPASRYPVTMNVFDQPTNFNRVSVSVTLWGLNHNRSADVSVLLVSPSGKQIMLMSNVGGNNSVSGGVLLFQQGYSPPSQSAAIPSGGPWLYGPSNYGQISQMPQVGTDPPPTHTGAYTANLDDLQYDDPNGLWKLYIYDWVQGASGNLSDSWEVRLKFQ